MGWINWSNLQRSGGCEGSIERKKQCGVLGTTEKGLNWIEMDEEDVEVDDEVSYAGTKCSET